ncbi:MAG TPA: hypothetical protein VM575_07205 [Nocardioides sp.]|nr:hypothetical protein [Nocardioides sp.]
MRWSRGAVPAMVLCVAATLAGCGTNDPTAPGAYGGGDPDFVTGSPVVFEEGQYPLGEYVDWDDTLRIRADIVEVDGDDRSAWLTVAVRAENTGSKPRLLPYLELSCDGRESGFGVAVEGEAPGPTRVPAHDSVEYQDRLALLGGGGTGESIPKCTGEVTINLSLDSTASSSTMAAWLVPGDVVDELNERRPTPESGGQQEVSPGVLVDVSVASVGGDGQRAWLSVMVDYDSSSDAEVPLDPPTLRCAESDGAGQARQSDLTVAGSGGMQVDLLMPPGDDGDPLTTCSAPAYVEIGPARWKLADEDLEYLNEELAREPGRPYSWVATDESFSVGYQVVVVPDASAAEALDALGPNRRKVSQERFWAIRVGEHDDGVVLFTWGLVGEEQVVALSRIGGLAASYSTSEDGGDQVLVARDGKVVRSFDPFLDQDYLTTKHLPEEKGLDLENDTGPASWTLLERLTKVHITQDWLMDEDHPAYLIK